MWHGNENPENETIYIYSEFRMYTIECQSVIIILKYSGTKDSRMVEVTHI